MAAFAVLESPEEFLNFFRWYDYPSFCKRNYEAFDKDIFHEISKYLIGDKKLFWEDLFRNYEPINIRANLFNSRDETNNNALYKSLNYLSADNYEYIKNNRDKINFSFMNADIRNLTNELTEKQDFITLSNLIIYAHCMYPNNPLDGFKELVEELSQNLNRNGQIMVGYLYNIENEDDDRIVYKKNLRDIVFNGSEYRYHYIRKMYDLHCDCLTENHDACLLYKKSK